MYSNKTSDKTMNRTIIRLSSLALLATAACCNNAAAQIILPHIEDFETGNKMIYMPLEGDPDPGAAGENVTWDFSKTGLGKDSIYIDILPLPDTLKAQFPQANSIERKSDSTTIIVDKQKGSSTLWGVIYQKTIYTYSAPYSFIKRPFAYGDQVSSAPARSYEAYGKINGKGSSLTVADSWGKLILPDGSSHKVLRVRFEQQYSDVYAGGKTMNMTLVTYAWFDETHKGALLKINKTKIQSPFYSNESRSADVLVGEH